MGFYIYRGHAPLGSEACGSDNKEIWRDLKTVRGAVNRAMKQYPAGFSLYMFADLYDPDSFQVIRVYTPQGE